MDHKCALFLIGDPADQISILGIAVFIKLLHGKHLSILVVPIRV